MATSGINTGAVSSTVVLTTLQSIVTAINAQTTNDKNINGSQDFFNVTAATYIKSGVGRIVNISVMVAGSASGTVYDAQSVTDTARPIYVIGHAATGIQNVNLPVQYGILVVPGTGQTLAGSFS